MSADNNRRRGYVMVYRSLMESPIFEDPQLLKLAIYLLLRANHRPRTIPVRTGRGTTDVALGPGQLLFGARSVAKKLRGTKTTVERGTKKLEKLGFLVRQPGHQFSIVSICNWETYQGGKKKRGAPSGEPSGAPTGAPSGPPTGPRQERTQECSNKNYKKRTLSGSFEEMNKEVLQSDTRLNAWFESSKRFGKLGSEDDQISVFALAELALRRGKNPSAYFIATLKKPGWKLQLSGDDENAGRLRLKRLQSPHELDRRRSDECENTDNGAEAYPLSDVLADRFGKKLNGGIAPCRK